MSFQIKTWLVRTMMDYNDRAERRQKPEPASPSFVVDIPSHSLRGSVPLHFFTPTSDSSRDASHADTKRPVIVVCHGGGFSSGRPSMDYRWISTLSGLSSVPVIVSVDYSLCPEHPWPAAIQDVAATLLWLTHGSAEKYNLDTSRVILVGFSAGGSLALTTPMWLAAHQDENLDLPHPLKGVVSIYPRTDFRGPRAQGSNALLEFLNQYWDAAFSKRSPVASPFVSVDAADDQTLQDSLPDRVALYCCGDDPLVEPTEQLRKRLTALGKHVTGHVEPGTAHAWDKMPMKDAAMSKKRDAWYLAIANEIESMLGP